MNKLETWPKISAYRHIVYFYAHGPTDFNITKPVVKSRLFPGIEGSFKLKRRVAEQSFILNAF